MNAEEILDYVSRWTDTTGWIEQSVTLEDPRCATVRFKFADAKPRKYMVVSKKCFSTLEGAAIYEMEEPEKSGYTNMQKEQDATSVDLMLHYARRSGYLEGALWVIAEGLCGCDPQVAAKRALDAVGEDVVVNGRLDKWRNNSKPSK